MTRNELRRYAWLDQELQQIEKQLEEVRERKYSIKIPKWSFVPGGGSVDDSMADRIVSAIDKENRLLKKYTEKWDELIALKLEIERAIEGLDPTEQILMRYRYFDGLQLWEIAREMNYSVVHVKRIHGKILGKMIPHDTFLCDTM